MKRRDFTEKRNTVRKNFAAEMVDKVLTRMEKPLIKANIDALENQYHWGSTDCVDYDEDGNELNDGAFNYEIAEEIAESIYYENNSFYDSDNELRELPSRAEMIKNLLGDIDANYDFMEIKVIKDESWVDTFERMTRRYNTGLEWYID